MPAILANAKNFLFNSDYPIEKVLATYSGSFTATAAPGAFSPFRTHQTITNSTGQTPLLVLIYSRDGGTSWQDGGVVIPTGGATPSFQTVEVNAYATSSQFVIVASNWITSAQTIYYKLAALSREA
jgi:hypothetical protein